MSTPGQVMINIEGYPALNLVMPFDGQPDILGLKLIEILKRTGYGHLENFVWKMLDLEHDFCIFPIEAKFDKIWSYSFYFIDGAHMLEDPIGLVVCDGETEMFNGAGDPEDVLLEFEKWVEDNK